MEQAKQMTEEDWQVAYDIDSQSGNPSHVWSKNGDVWETWKPGALSRLVQGNIKFVTRRKKDGLVIKITGE